MRGKIKMLLGDLQDGKKARVKHIHESSKTARIVHRIREMGILEGAEVEVKRRAPFGKDPIAVYIRGTLIGMRKSEANLISVESLTEQSHE